MKVRQYRLPVEIYAKALGEKEPKGFYHQRQTSRNERASLHSSAQAYPSLEVDSCTAVLMSRGLGTWHILLG